MSKCTVGDFESSIEEKHMVLVTVLGSIPREHEGFCFENSRFFIFSIWNKFLEIFVEVTLDYLKGF